MPVHIYEDDAFDKMAAVEQDERWEEMQKDGRFGDASFQAFHEEWETNYKPFQGRFSPRHLSQDGFTVNGTGAVYGADGFNRYTVRCSGEIMFITRMARSPEDQDRAIEQGFRLFPDDMLPG